MLPVFITRIIKTTCCLSKNDLFFCKIIFCTWTFWLAPFYIMDLLTCRPYNFTFTNLTDGPFNQGTFWLVVLHLKKGKCSASLRSAYFNSIFAVMWSTFIYISVMFIIHINLPNFLGHIFSETSYYIYSYMQIMYVFHNIFFIFVAILVPQS